MDPVTPNKGIDLPLTGEYVNAWGPVVNQNFTEIDTAFGGTTSISVTGVGAGTIALTLTQYQPPNIEFTGTLGANLNYQIPTGVGGIWTISNATSGAFNLTFSIAGGSSITLPATRTLIVSDGTNVAIADSATAAAALAAAETYAAAQAAAALTAAEASAASLYAPIISPTLTGVPAAPTAGPGTNTTQIATTAFVTTSLVPFATLASPTFTGIPRAPTAAAGTSTTQLATTAFAVPGSNLAVPGHRKNADGSIDQWGTITAVSGSFTEDVAITFDIPFPNACFHVSVTSNRSVASAGQATNGSGFANGYTGAGPISGCTVTIDNTAGNPSVYHATYHAIGY